MKKKSLISIIIPVYNAEQYIAQCLESIISQTYKEIEILCINDGSSDNSIKILNEYKNKDSRIVVLDKENEGVSKTRNIGLKKAKGEYLMFVDADDWIDCDTCENAELAMQKNDCDVVLWSYISESQSRQSKKMLFPNDITFEKKEVREKIHRRLIGICDEELTHPELADSLCTVWGKLYKKEIILENNISFVDLAQIGTYEDGIFNLEVFYYVNRAIYLNKTFYHYRRENENSITSKYREKLFSQWQNLFWLMENYIEEKDLSNTYNRALSNRISLSILGLGLNELACQCSSFEKIKKIRKILINKRYREAYKNLELQYFPFYWKVFYGLAKCGNALGVYLLLAVIKKIISR